MYGRGDNFFPINKLNSVGVQNKPKMICQIIIMRGFIKRENGNLLLANNVPAVVKSEQGESSRVLCAREELSWGRAKHYNY